MKFNSYDYTHSPFNAEDVEGLLDLVNRLLEYTGIVGEIDLIMHDVIRARFPLILPSHGVTS